jgi:5-methylcytosine-specific restriction endonuclease McrA
MKALKLDASFRPIGVIDSRDALILCLYGKAKVIETHNKNIKSVTNVFQLPAVIALNTYVRYRLKVISNSPRKGNIFWRDKNTCQYCVKKLAIKDLTIDHILPKSRGGKNSWENLTTSCKKCNQKKANRTPEEAGMKLFTVPRKPSSFLFKNIKPEQISELWSNYLWSM